MTKRYIGSALTNSNGIATFEYPGQGNGKTKIIAQVGEIELKPYQFIDYLIYDSGTDANHDWSVRGNPTITTTNGYTEITTNGTTTAEIIYNTELTGDFQVSVEVQALDTIRLGLYCDDSYKTHFMTFDNRFLLYQIRRINGIITARITSDYGQTWHDVTSFEADTLENNPCNFRFWIPVPQGNTARTLRFRNLRIQKSMDDSYTPTTIINSLTVSTNKLILSEAHNDEAVITAVLDGSNVRGKTITFKKGSTILDTVQADNNGEASYTYTSQGEGDITIIAEYGSLSDHVTIEDCKYIKFDEIHYVSEYSSGDHGIDIDGNVSMDLRGKYKISFDAKANNGSSIRSRFLLGSKSHQNSDGIYNYNFGAHLETNIITAMYRTTGYTTYWGPDVPCVDTYAHYEFIKDGKTLTCYINGNQQGTSTTLSWIDDYTDYLFFWWVYRLGTIYVKNVKVKSWGGIDSLSVTIDNNVLSYADGDEAIISAILTGDNVDYQSVSFKNGSTVLYTTTTDSNGIATYTYESQGIGDITITAECAEFSDDVDIEDCLYAPKLDGTETIHQLHGTTTIANNEMYGDGGYIGAFDNTGNWELTFEGKLETGNCAVIVIKSDETMRDNNEIISPWKSVWKYVNGQSTSYNFTNELEYNTYYSYKITKNNNAITFEVNGNVIQFDWSLATTLPTLGIGVDNWGNGGTAYIKDIKVKSLPNTSLSVTTDNNVLSYIDGDEATISATLSGSVISGQSIVFKNGSTVLATKTTNSNGVATYTYSSQGAGDVTITVECGQLSDDVTIEDILFARMTEYFCTKTSGYVKQQFFDNDVSFDLPNDFELELEFWSDGPPTSNNQEQRLFVMPKSLYVEGSQPSTAFFIGDTHCGEWDFGVRRNGSTSSEQPTGFVCEQYQKVKFKRQTDDKIYLYLNDATTPYDWYYLSAAFNHHDWSICFHLWYDGTVKIRNIKLTEL